MSCTSRSRSAAVRAVPVSASSVRRASASCFARVITFADHARNGRLNRINALFQFHPALFPTPAVPVACLRFGPWPRRNGPALLLPIARGGRVPVPSGSGGFHTSPVRVELVRAACQSRRCPSARWMSPERPHAKNPVTAAIPRSCVIGRKRTKRVVLSDLRKQALFRQPVFQPLVQSYELSSKHYHPVGSFLGGGVQKIAHTGAKHAQNSENTPLICSNRGGRVPAIY